MNQPSVHWYPTTVYFDGPPSGCCRCAAVLISGEARWSARRADNYSWRKNSRWRAGPYCHRCAMNGELVLRPPIPRSQLASVTPLKSGAPRVEDVVMRSWFARRVRDKEREKRGESND